MTLTEAMLLEDVRRQLFAPSGSHTPRAIGAELELIPVHAATNGVVPARSTAAILARVGDYEGWRTEVVEDDPPAWHVADGARISFEPGGQIEISSSPHAEASTLIYSLQRLAATLTTELESEGIALLARGVDPYNGIEAVPLQLRRERYTKMTDYFNSVGPHGIRMMRQTAALQINVERGSDPLVRWRLLNALAPVAVALFANSRAYAGADTGFSSYRSHLWRTLDPTRTGIVYDASDPAGHYLRFALAARAIYSEDKLRPGRYQTFGEWMKRADLTVDDWQFHLSTLFPEVRPKSYFELRSPDTIEVDAIMAPIVFVAGLVYDSDSARESMALLGEPSSPLLNRAAKDGLADPMLRDLAARVASLALRGARSLGPEYVSDDHVRSAEEYFARTLDDHSLVRLS